MSDRLTTDGRDVGFFATGGKKPKEGGSGVRKLFEHAAIANRVAVIVTNYENGGIKTVYDELNPDAPIGFEVIRDFPKRGEDGEFSPEDKIKIQKIYRDIMQKYGLKKLLCSGWIKQVYGLKASEVVSIHPGPHGKYGGDKMHGNHVHEEIWKDYFDGKIVSSAVTMNFIQSGFDDKMDNGEGIIIQVPVLLEGCKNPSDIKKRVNAMEHKIQWQVSQYIIDGEITWSGVKGEPVQFEEGLTIDIDGTPFPLDGKLVDLSQGLGGYGNTVVKAGDNASGNFKDKCDAANKNTTAAKSGLIQQTSTGAWETYIAPSDTPTRIKEDIDGVGTKVQIYLAQFENLCRQYRDTKISEEECIQKSKGLWIRMLHDLIAMNVDDLRDGQMAVMVTNIIDINHLRGERGRIFSASMGGAMEETISELDISIGSGETALAVGHTRSAEAYRRTICELSASLLDIPDLTKEQIQHIKNKQSNYTVKVGDIDNQIDLNIGGTVQGLIKKDKLIPLEEGHVLVALYEKPDENGIIGPRANGISTIRSSMEKLAGSVDWPSMTFEDFLAHIGSDKAKLPDKLLQECAGLTLGQIATGITTVFNPFVSRDLLGGLDGEPEVLLSSITNVTGNPKHKIKNGLRGAENMAVDINMTTTKLPQVIEIIQRLTGMSDEEAMSSWNMGVPYVLACPPSEVEKIIEKAKKRGIKAEAIGTVKAKKEGDNIITLQGVGVGKSKIAA